MKYSFVIALLIGAIAAHKSSGIFELSQHRIIKEELEKKQAKELLQKEAEEELRET